MALPARRTTTYQAVATKRITVEAKRTSTGARSLLAQRRATYKATDTARVSPQATASKSGAASYPLTEAAKDVASAYGDSAKQFAKIELADTVIKQISSYIPRSKTANTLAKIPFVNKYLSNKEEAIVKGIIVTIAPTLLVKFAGDNKVAITMAESIIDLGARDGISIGADIVSTKFTEFYEAFSKTVEE